MTWEEPPTAEPWDSPAVPDESGVDEPEPPEQNGGASLRSGCKSA